MRRHRYNTAFIQNYCWGDGGNVHSVRHHQMYTEFSRPPKKSGFRVVFLFHEGKKQCLHTVRVVIDGNLRGGPLHPFQRSASVHA